MMLKNTIKILAILPLFGSSAASSSHLNSPLVTYRNIDDCPNAPKREQYSREQVLIEAVEQEQYKKEVQSALLLCKHKEIDSINRLIISAIPRPLTNEEKAQARHNAHLAHIDPIMMANINHFMGARPPMPVIAGRNNARHDAQVRRNILQNNAQVRRNILNALNEAAQINEN